MQTAFVIQIVLLGPIRDKVFVQANIGVPDSLQILHAYQR
jgi:hypothetical protein